MKKQEKFLHAEEIDGRGRERADTKDGCGTEAAGFDNAHYLLDNFRFFGYIARDVIQSTRLYKELIENKRRYAPNFGKWLANAYGLRNFAQYHFDPPRVKEIRRMANHAKEFIQKIEEILTQMKPRRTISKRQLRQYLNELIALAKTVTPDVEPIIHIPGDEEQHAWLKLYVPNEFVDQVDDLISERVYEIFINDGCDIAALAYEKSLLQQTPVEANAWKKTIAKI